MTKYRSEKVCTIETEDGPITVTKSDSGMFFATREKGSPFFAANTSYDKVIVMVFNSLKHKKSKIVLTDLHK